jgi:outer membrane lipoprotein-sorting protein
MTKFLRTASTRRLIATIAGAIAVVGAGTAIAVAASGTGPVPSRKPLAQAVHQALAAPQVKGISARIKFTNHLIDSSDLQGSDPILSGATGRLWLSDHRLRLELQSDNGDAQIVVDNRSFWAYDPMSKTVYEGTLPAEKSHEQQAAQQPIPSLSKIQANLNRLAHHLNLSGAIPGDVAGQGTYTIRVSPKHDGGLLGAGELAWDAARGVPLRIAVYARGQSSPVLQVKATDISYGTVPASDFNIKPPSGAKVVRVASPADHAGATGHRGAAAKARGATARHRHAEVTGTTAVASKLPFKLVAPKTLDGLTRRSTTLLDWGGTPAALVAYGQNLGGVAVIEQVAKPGAQAAPSGSDQPGLTLPTVSINGATGQELDTALGTMIRFTRGGVTYTVIGSVPPAAAELAARAL